jgi:hypothetical protein
MVGRQRHGALGDDAKRWIAHFDKQWCRDHATEWKQHHAWLAQVRERCKLTAQQAQSNADEMVELARLSRHLDPRAPVQPLYALALQRSPGHAGALRGWCKACPTKTARASPVPGAALGWRR